MTVVPIFPYACSTCGGPSLSWVLKSLGLSPYRFVAGSPGCPFCEHGPVFPLPVSEDDQCMYVPGLDPRTLSEPSLLRLRLARRAEALGAIHAAALYALGAACACEQEARRDHATLIHRAVLDLWNRDPHVQASDPQSRPDLALLRLDIMRRVGRFDDAVILVNKVLPTLPADSFAQGPFHYELDLIRSCSVDAAERFTGVHFEVDGSHRKTLGDATPGELRDIGVRDIAALLDGLTHQDVMARDDAARELIARRQPIVKPVLTKEERATALRERTRVREIFRLAREHPRLQNALSFWKSSQAFFESSLVSDAVLYEMSLDEIASHLSDATSGRCPHCRFRFGLTMVDEQRSCDHCGWPKPRFPRLPKPRQSPPISQQVQRLIAEGNRCRHADSPPRPAFTGRL